MPGVDRNNKEDDYEANSVARGVFVFKKGVAASVDRNKADKSSSSGRKRKRAIKAKAAAANRAKKSTDEDEDGDPYKWTWRRASDSFARLQQQTFSEVLDAVADFVARSSSSSSTSSASASSATIRACALLTGVNLPDHDFLFRLLATKLRKEVSPHVASLKARGGSGVSQKAMVRAAVAQLMLVDTDDDDTHGDSDDEEEDEAPEVARTNLVFPVLERWYNNQYPAAGEEDRSASAAKSPKKKAKASLSSSRPPLVVVLEDFEGFSAAVLQDFVLNLAEYASTLPLVLVFGVATTVSAVHLKLPHHVSSYLSIETFSGQRATEIMAKAVEHVVMDPEVPFKLGGKCMQFLLEIFLFSDFSVKKFINAYKYCLLEHYGRSPVIPLLCVPDVAARSANAKVMSDAQLDLCRSLPSFRRFVEADPVERASLLVDGDAFRRFLATALEELDAATVRFGRGAAALHAVTRDLPGSPLGKQLYSAYHACLTKTAVKSHEYREAFQFLAHLTCQNLIQKMQVFHDCLEDCEDVKVKTVVSDASKHLSRLREFESSAFGTPDNKAAKDNKSSPASSSSSPSPQAGRKMTRTDLQKRLLEQTLERKRQLSPYESLRKESLDFLHASFFSLLASPARLPFAEVRYFDASASVKRHLMAFPRGVVTAALEDPYVYLEDPRLEGNAGPTTDFPDVCVAFGLHREAAGKLVNLYDWMQGWISVVNPDRGDGEEDEVDPVDQARFTQAVSALQFLGFVKPSKRKTDHVAKLTWGD